MVAPRGVPVDLFAEGPSAEWALPLPGHVGIKVGEPDRHTFTLDLDGAPPGASFDGAALTLTATAGERAIEVTTRLD
jgi:hypothetical protein